MFLGAIQSSSLIIQAGAQDEAAQITAPSFDRLFYISLAAGLSLLSASWMFFRLSGGLFNPAVILSSLIIGAISIRRFALYFVAQVYLKLNRTNSLIHCWSDRWRHRCSRISRCTNARPNNVYVRLTISPNHLLTSVNRTRLANVNRAQGVFIEAFATAILVLTILMLNAERHRATSMAPIGIAMTYFVLHLWALPLTGASMNPARSFGSAILDGFDNAHWIVSSFTSGFGFKLIILFVKVLGRTFCRKSHGCW